MHYEEEMFCLSAAPTFKVLTPQQKAFCKLQIQHILFSVKFDSMSETAMSP